MQRFIPPNSQTKIFPADFGSFAGLRKRNLFPIQPNLSTCHSGDKLFSPWSILFCGNAKTITCIVDEVLVEEVVQSVSAFDDFEDRDDLDDVVVEITRQVHQSSQLFIAGSFYVLRKTLAICQPWQPFGLLLNAPSPGRYAQVINLDGFWLIRNFEKRFSYLDWVLMFCLHRRLTAEINPKKVRGPTCKLYLIWKAAREKKWEDSSIKCLTCVNTLNKPVFIKNRLTCILNYYQRVLPQRWRQKMSFRYYRFLEKTSDQITSISFTKGSDIFKLLTSFWLRFPFNIASPLFLSSSESKSRFHLLQLSGSQIFLDPCGFKVSITPKCFFRQNKSFY